MIYWIRFKLNILKSLSTLMSPYIHFKSTCHLNNILSRCSLYTTHTHFFDAVWNPFRSPAPQGLRIQVCLIPLKINLVVPALKRTRTTLFQEWRRVYKLYPRGSLGFSLLVGPAVIYSGLAAILRPGCSLSQYTYINVYGFYQIFLIKN